MSHDSGRLVIGDVHEIFSRLFDHRPFLQGEIVSFKKEFEEKRGDREVEQLFKVLEHITEIKQVRFEKVVESSDANLPRTIADIQVALRMCEETLKVENKFKSSEFLAKKREDRCVRLVAAQLDNEEKLKRLKDLFEQKEIEVERQFEQLERTVLAAD